ncbi:MAG TPA: extracellular solute-binding protein [Burkholderiaceae bacterium]|nr:extracellular solute-binding protein [Burkholderiaceae bacterium]
MTSLGQRVRWAVRRLRHMPALLAGAALTIAAHAPAAAQTDWAKVAEAAKKEGKVVLYTANVGVRFHHDIAAAFEKKYGIPVEILEARASELRERIRTEQAAGRSIGDVSHNGATTTALQLKDGTFQPYGDLPAVATLQPQYKTDGIRIPLFSIVYGILVNTRQVPAGSEPRSWKDLLDPKWKGKILSDDMRALGGGSVMFFVTTDAFGRGFHEKLAEQAPVFTRDISDAERRVARGEMPVYIPFTFANFRQLKGLPVKAVVPAEGATYVNYEVALLKGAPHPNAARLLMNFFLEKEAQAIYANGGYVPTAKGVSASAPPEIRELIEVKLLGTTSPERQNEMLNLAKELYK